MQGDAMAWTILVVAGLLEIAWAIGLKTTEGFTKPLATVLTVAAMVASMALLGLAVRTIPVGTGYAVWTGIGALGTVALGMWFFGEPVTFWRVLFLMMILGGIIGLKVTA